MPTKEWRENNPEKIRSSRNKWYQNNKEKAIRAVLNRKKELSEWWKEYKSGLKCGKCEENHPSCIEFHHLDPKEKEINLAMVITQGWSKERILDEIKKCIVLCANCHRKLHFES